MTNNKHATERVFILLYADDILLAAASVCLKVASASYKICLSPHWSSHGCVSFIIFCRRCYSMA